MGPRRHVIIYDSITMEFTNKKICIFLSQKAECSSGKAPINLAAGCGFEAHSVSYFFAKKWRGKAAGPAGPMSSRWYTSQTINDDLVLLLYDDYFVFVIILRAKAPSLVTNDEPAHFVIECSHSVTKLVIVTSESSLMNTFLVVIKGVGDRSTCSSVCIPLTRRGVWV